MYLRLIDKLRHELDLAEAAYASMYYAKQPLVVIRRWRHLLLKALLKEQLKRFK